ncbi:MarR family transcriptional regulator [Rhizobium sp. BK376]|uniref:MarR family winged helix-turn-helix transcriptional regulator n=1 Tax=Rhizobium sp. BK376 TaxID=2512149 RepID=UPI00104F3474|nr:MarR family transcriptional regulator [Rhizobium sp. BK376]TCR79529.1 DNA-binding MarR family transcriptional regulator [Rhizobium sp. BK376]
MQNGDQEVPSQPRHSDKAAGAYTLAEQIGYLLRQANQRHVAIFTSRMNEKLTTTQWAALVKLRDLQPCSQVNLGRETAMDVATIKGVVDRLAKRNLVRTAPDTTDARRLVLTLTEEGEAAVARNLPVANDISEETLSTLSSAERAMLAELLRKIS